MPAIIIIAILFLAFFYGIPEKGGKKKRKKRKKVEFPTDTDFPVESWEVTKKLTL